MPNSVDGINAAIREIEEHKQKLWAELEECDEALSGLEKARRLLCPPAASIPQSSTQQAQAGATTGGVEGRRRGERAIPERLERAVRDYIGSVGRRFNIKELRDALHGHTYQFNEDETGDILTSLLRQMADSGDISVKTRGVGRRLAEYAPPGLPDATPLYGEKGELVRDA